MSKISYLDDKIKSNITSNGKGDIDASVMRNVLTTMSSYLGGDIYTTKEEISNVKLGSIVNVGNEAYDIEKDTITKHNKPSTKYNPNIHNLCKYIFFYGTDGDKSLNFEAIKYDNVSIEFMDIEKKLRYLMSIEGLDDSIVVKLDSNTVATYYIDGTYHLTAQNMEQFNSDLNVKQFYIHSILYRGDNLYVPYEVNHLIDSIIYGTFEYNASATPYIMSNELVKMTTDNDVITDVEIDEIFNSVFNATYYYTEGGIGTWDISEDDEI